MEFLIWGTGKPLREFLYVDDLADAIELIIKQNLKIDLVNVGGRNQYKGLAEKIKSIVGYEGKLKFNSDMQMITLESFWIVH